MMKEQRIKMKKKDIKFLNFPDSWSKIKDHSETLKPENIWEFLNSVKVSEEEVKKGRPVKKMFVL